MADVPTSKLTMFISEALLRRKASVTWFKKLTAYPFREAQTLKPI